MDALCALLDCALGFFPCYFLFGCKRRQARKEIKENFRGYDFAHTVTNVKVRKPSVRKVEYDELTIFVRLFAFTTMNWPEIVELCPGFSSLPRRLAKQIIARYLFNLCR